MIKKPGLDILFSVGTTDKLILIRVSGAPLTCPDAPVDRRAVGRVAGSGAADCTQADVVLTARVHAFQNTVSRSGAVVGVEHRQMIPGAPLKVKVIIISVFWTAPGDLQ